MTEKADRTRLRIINSAKKEFLEKGFNKASLRKIAKDAGVTTGAMYGSFKDKESLFDEIVRECADYFSDKFLNAHLKFISLDKERQINEMRTYSDDVLIDLVNYMFDHLDEFRLIISFSEGTKYSNWIEQFVKIEEDSSKEFIKTLKAEGRKVEELSPEILHMLASSFIYGVMETISHQMGKEKAFKNIMILRKYSSAGWAALLDL